MWAEDFIHEARALAEELMIDACRVERSLGEMTDPITGIVSDAWEIVYEGNFKLTGNKAQAGSPVAGGHMFTVENLMAHFPVTAQCKLDDRLTVLSAELDADLVGLQFRLSDLARGSYRTADRWNVELVTG